VKSSASHVRIHDSIVLGALSDVAYTFLPECDRGHVLLLSSSLVAAFWLGVRGSSVVGFLRVNVVVRVATVVAWTVSF